MKQLIAYSALAGITAGLIMTILCCMTGCRTVKSMEHSSYVRVKDTLHTDTLERVRDVSSSIVTRETKDSTVGVAGSTVAYTGNGDTTVRNGNATLRTYTGRDGRKRTECACDSITLVVTKLVRENSSLVRYKDSLRATGRQVAHVADSSDYLQETVMKGNAGFVAWVGRMLWYLLVLVLGFAAGYIYKKLSV